MGVFKNVLISILLEAIPFVLLGVVLAALLQMFVTEEMVRRWMPSSPWKGLLFGTALGLLFPICECGMIPVIRRLLQKGMPPYIAVVFIISGPVLNPIVFFSTYMAFRAQPEMAYARMGLAFVVALVVGWIVYRTVVEHPLKEEHRPRGLGGAGAGQSGIELSVVGETGGWDSGEAIASGDAESGALDAAANLSSLEETPVERRHFIKVSSIIDRLLDGTEPERGWEIIGQRLMGPALLKSRSARVRMLTTNERMLNGIYGLEDLDEVEWTESGDSESVEQESGELVSSELRPEPVPEAEDTDSVMQESVPESEPEPEIYYQYDAERDALIGWNRNEVTYIEVEPADQSRVAAFFAEIGARVKLLFKVRKPRPVRVHWQLLRRRLSEFFAHASLEFFEMGKYLVLGCLITAAVHTFVARDVLVAVSDGAVGSHLFMMAFAYVLSICSTSDAFVASSFSMTFSGGALLAFLVFGPMLDAKTTLMMLAVFRKKFVLYLAGLLVASVFVGSLIVGALVF